MASATDLLQKVGIQSATTLDSNYTVNDTTVTVISTSGWPTDTGITFAMDEIDGNGIQVPGTYNEFVGTVATATSITNVDYADGTGDRNYTAGATTRVYIPVSKTRENRIVEWGTEEHAQDGTHTDVTATSLTVSGTSAFTGAVTLPDSTITTAKINDTTVTSEKLKSTVGFYATTTQTINNSATADVTTYTEVVDYGADFDNTTGVFTAPYAGLYHFDVNMSVTDVGSATGRVESNLLVNGAAKGHAFGQGAATNNDPSMNQSITISLAANDAVKVSITNNSGANEPLVDASFSGFLVGRV